MSVSECVFSNLEDINFLHRILMAIVIFRTIIFISWTYQICILFFQNICQQVKLSSPSNFARDVRYILKEV